jgi:hypothetical protein
MADFLAKIMVKNIERAKMQKDEKTKKIFKSHKIVRNF